MNASVSATETANETVWNAPGPTQRMIPIVVGSTRRAAGSAPNTGPVPPATVTVTIVAARKWSMPSKIPTVPTAWRSHSTEMWRLLLRPSVAVHPAPPSLRLRHLRRYKSVAVHRHPLRHRKLPAVATATARRSLCPPSRMVAQVMCCPWRNQTNCEPS